MGADLRASEFTVDLVHIPPNPAYITEAADAFECYIHTLTIAQKLEPERTRPAGENFQVSTPQRKPARKKRRLLVIVGYAGSGVSFFPMFQGLREEYEITAVDVLGFGCSGRPAFKSHTVEGVNGWFEW